MTYFGRFFSFVIHISTFVSSFKKKKVLFNEKFLSKDEISIQNYCGQDDNSELYDKAKTGSEQILCDFYYFYLLNSLNYVFCCYFSVFLRIFICFHFNHCVYALRYCF